MDSDMERILTKMNELEGIESRLSFQMDTFTRIVSSLQETVSGLVSTVQGLNLSINTLTIEFKHIRTDLDATKVIDSEATKRLDERVSSAEHVIHERVNKVEGRVGTLENKMSGIEGQSSYKQWLVPIAVTILIGAVEIIPKLWHTP